MNLAAKNLGLITGCNSSYGARHLLSSKWASSLPSLPKNKDDDGDGGSDDDNGGNREHIMFQGMLTFISILTLIV